MVYEDDEVVEGEVWKPLDPDFVKGQEGTSSQVKVG